MPESASAEIWEISHIRVIVTWCECGFNLVTRAQRLAIQRKTVIYRLDKVSRLTAREIREPAVAIALNLACLVGD